MGISRNDTDCGGRHTIESVYNAGNWFMFSRHFLYAMDPAEAIFLQYLINWSSRVNAIDLHDGWFYCSAKRIQKEMVMTIDTQTRRFKVLKGLGVIETKMEGMPAKRWILINYNKIKDLINEGYDRWMDKFEGIESNGKPTPPDETQ